MLPLLVMAARPWSDDELRSGTVTVPGQALPPLTDYVSRYNYLLEIRQTCDFVARYQVSDSLSPNFGGIIEAEHMPTVIETDNTQEAIWIWSRWYELTGLDRYRENIRRAWHYVRNFPAFREGSGSSTWYAVWNCGLGFFCEGKYRAAYGDSSFLAYADTCRQFLFSHPLNFASNPLHGNVTALAAGMAYDYATARGDAVLRDTALAYGMRVKAWVESQPSRLRTGNWAMSGGTIVWGLCRSVLQHDTMLGRNWLAVYGDSVPYFMPSGTWNCSWNVWNANAFREAYAINHDPRYRQYHQRLTDTLLGRDIDDDGGIPATWTDPPNQDQTWVSTYLDFMGMDWLQGPLFEQDAGVLELHGFEPGRTYLPGDTVPVAAVVANFGRQQVSFPLTLRAGGRDSLVQVGPLGFLEADTFDFGRIVLPLPGMATITAFTGLVGDERRSNDTLRDSVQVRSTISVQGQLRDSFTRAGIRSEITVFLRGESLPYTRLTTDSSGRFAFPAIDSGFRFAVRPEIPYPEREWQAAIRHDTFLLLELIPANLLLVNNDSLSRYESFYTPTFDTLGLAWCRLRRRDAGLPGVAALNRLRDRLVVWYTGQTLTGNLKPEDIDSLGRFLDSGGRLFITGQNIGQELSATPFFRDRLHARLVRCTTSSVFLFGNVTDSLGAYFGTTQTAGPLGANNQNSRDEIAPDSLARAFVIYDTLTAQVAGIYHHDPGTGSRIIYLGFGFEALNQPQQRPNYMSRVQFFGRSCNWLTGLTAVLEPDCGPARPEFELSLAPNPARDFVRVDLTLPAPGRASLRLFDVTGRLVSVLSEGYQTAGSSSFSIHRSSFSSGVYLLELRFSGLSLARKLVIE